MIHEPFLLPDGRMAGTDRTVAALSHRHRSLVARHCKPIGREVGTGCAVYDVESACAILAALPRRTRRAA